MTNSTLSALSVAMFSVYNACVAVDKAAGKATVEARNAAARIYENTAQELLDELRDTPKDIKGFLSEQYQDASKELGKRIKSFSAWKNAKSMTSAAFLLTLFGDEQVTVQANGEEKKIAASATIGNVNHEREATKQLKEKHGLANKRTPRAAKPAEPEKSAETKSQKTYALDVSGAKTWLSELLKLDSGFGILDQALRSRGFYVATIGTAEPVQPPAEQPKAPKAPKAAKPKAAKPKAEQPAV